MLASSSLRRRGRHEIERFVASSSYWFFRRKSAKYILEYEIVCNLPLETRYKIVLAGQVRMGNSVCMVPVSNVVGEQVEMETSADSEA